MQETSLSPDFSWSRVHAPVRPDRWVPAQSWEARPPQPHPAQNTIHLPATEQGCSFDASLLRVAHGGSPVSGLTNSVTQAEPHSSLCMSSNCWNTVSHHPAALLHLQSCQSLDQELADSAANGQTWPHLMWDFEWHVIMDFTKQAVGKKFISLPPLANPGARFSSPSHWLISEDKQTPEWFQLC